VQITESAGGTGHLAEALFALCRSGHFEQVVSEGARVLDREPEDAAVHYLMALAQLGLNRPAGALNHVNCLLSHYPDWAPSHHAASIYFRSVCRLPEARRHIQTAISLDPNVSHFHFVSAILALLRNDLPQARASVERARQLDPQDPNIIRLAVEIQGVSQTTAREAWERIRELEAALALDPNNAGLHASIGSIFLDELDQPREAEESFRSALLNDPSDRDNQKALFRAVGRQRMLYRLLSIPQRAFAWMGNVFRGFGVQPWRLIFLVIAFKAVIAFLIWLFLVTLVFWPSCKLYEWLVMSEIQCVAEASDRHLRFKRALGRWPFWLRFSACMGLILGSWFLLFASLGIVTCGFAELIATGRFFELDAIGGFVAMVVTGGFVSLGIFAGIHFIVTLALFFMRKERSSHGRWAADRGRKRNAVLPPVPSAGPPPLSR
jgi:tetratricopeptide (TPR) repeat protein